MFSAIMSGAMGLLSKPAGIIALVAVIAVGGWLGSYEVRLRIARAGEATAVAALATEKARGAGLEAQLMQARTNQAMLLSTIERQNKDVEALRAMAGKASDAAALAAVRTLREGANKREQAERVAGSGPAAMNEWLKHTLPPR